MLVKRTMKVDVEHFKVEDIIRFNMTDGEKVQAMAVKQTPEGMLFVLVDCLVQEYPMFNDMNDMNKEDISFATSDLLKALKGEILERFPKEIRNRMVQSTPREIGFVFLLNVKSLERMFMDKKKANSLNAGSL